MKFTHATWLLVIVMFGAVSPALADARAAVEAVLRRYQVAITQLNADEATPLFALDARIFGRGGDEGVWGTYLTHHLKPEFAEFKTFAFSNYQVSVTIMGTLAYASETYSYELEITETDARVARLGAATSVLQKT
ncbi:MAG: nuclear transport factor 2 family protein [Alphaproteobacteria bacterium]